MERSRSSLTLPDETRQKVERLTERVEHGIAYSTFHEWHVVGSAGEPAFQNSWTNYDLTAYPAAAFWKDSSGIVHLRGLVKSGGLNIIFGLPPGYRIGPNVSIGTRANIFGVHAGGAEGRIDIYNTGAVLLAAGSTGYVALSGICFRAEN